MPDPIRRAIPSILILGIGLALATASAAEPTVIGHEAQGLEALLLTLFGLGVVIGIFLIALCFVSLGFGVWVAGLMLKVEGGFWRSFGAGLAGSLISIPLVAISERFTHHPLLDYLAGLLALALGIKLCLHPTFARAVAVGLLAQLVTIATVILLVLLLPHGHPQAVAV